MSLEPSPETQAAFMEADKQVMRAIDYLVRRAPHWIPATLIFMGMLHLVQALPWLLQCLLMGSLLWVLLNSGERDKALSWLWASAVKLFHMKLTRAPAPQPLLNITPPSGGAPAFDPNYARPALGLDGQTEPNKPILPPGALRVALYLALAAIVVWMLLDRFSFGKSADEVRADQSADAAKQNRVAAEAQTDLSHESNELAAEAHEREIVIERYVDRVRREIVYVSPQNDPVAAWGDGIDCLRNEALACASGA